MTRNLAAELDKLLFESGLKVKFGLRAQGHLPRVNWMLAHGATWDEIGDVIGWHGPTAQKFYERIEHVAAAESNRRK